MLHASVVKDQRFISMLVANGRPGRLLDDSRLVASYSSTTSSASFPDLFADTPLMRAARQSMFELVETFVEQTWAFATCYPENITAMLPASGFWRDDRQRLPANLVLGTIANNQAEAEHRIPTLLQVPAQTRFVSHIEVNSPISYPLNGAIRHSFDATGLVDENLLQCVCCGSGVWESIDLCPACRYSEKTEWEARDFIHFVQLPDPVLAAVNQQWAHQLRIDYQRAGVPIFGETAASANQAS